MLSIPKVADMNVDNRTAVQHGFPGFFIGAYSGDGLNLALKYLSKAIEENPTESIWYYTKADYMVEMERSERLVVKMPSDEEFKLLEKALQIKSAAIYTSYLAALYRQCSKELNRRILFSRHKNEARTKELNEKSYKLYR